MSLALTLVVVFEKEWPRAGIERRRDGLRLDGVVLLDLFGHGNFLAHCEIFQSPLCNKLVCLELVTAVI